MNNGMMKAAGAGLYMQTNESGSNRLLAFSRAHDGSLVPQGTFATGEKGSECLISQAGARGL